MSGKRKKLIKSPKFFLGITLAVLSLEIYLGVICGYLAAKFLSGKEAGIQGRIKSLIIDAGKWKIHFHHWLYGLCILISIFLMPLPVPKFSFGILGGLIFQGIVCYPDWHKIIIRKKQL